MALVESDAQRPLEFDTSQPVSIPVPLPEPTAGWLAAAAVLQLAALRPRGRIVADHFEIGLVHLAERIYVGEEHVELHEIYERRGPHPRVHPRNLSHLRPG